MNLNLNKLENLIDLTLVKDFDTEILLKTAGLSYFFVILNKTFHFEYS